MAYLPCQNPNCRSHGKPHPNCRCYDYIHGNEKNRLAKEGVQFPERIKKAHGGEIKHYCSELMAHDPKCEYYADGGEVEANNEFINNPDLAVDHAVTSHGLHHLLTKTGNSKSPDTTMNGQDLLDHSKRGSNKIESHIKSLFDKNDTESKSYDIQPLKDHLERVEKDPSHMLTVGGNLGDNMSDHAAIVSAKAANAVNYLQSIKPMGSQGTTLDSVLPPNKMDIANYNRQLSIAQNPLSIIPHIKQGTVQPADLTTLHTLYPKLAQKMIAKATMELADAKGEEKKMSYKQKQGLSLLLQEPLDSTMTIQSMRAIIASQVPKAAPPQQGGNKKASGVQLKQIDQANKMAETQLQERQIDKKA